MLQSMKDEWSGSSEARVSLYRAVQMNQSWPFIFGTSRVLSVTKFLIIRFAFAALFTGVIIADMVLSFDDGYYFIYLTRWSFVVEMVYFWLAAYTTFQTWRLGHGQVSTSSDMMPWYVRGMYFLWSLAMPVVICVCFVYWSLLQPVWAIKLDELSFFSIFEHFLNTVIFFVELYLCRNSFHLLLASTCFFSYCCVYSVWSYIAFAAKVGTFLPCDKYPRNECPIYNVIDWHAPAQTLAIIIGLNLFGLSIVLLVWILTGCRSSVDKTRMHNNSAEAPCLSSEAA